MNSLFSGRALGMTLLSVATVYAYSPVQFSEYTSGLATDSNREGSDIDILMVSSDFEGMAYYKRPKLFYRHWEYDELPDPEFICLTPAQFEERKTKQPHIVRTAVNEGVSVA